MVKAKENAELVSTAGVLVSAIDWYRHLGLVINHHLTWTDYLHAVYFFIR